MLKMGEVYVADEQHNVKSRIIGNVNPAFQYFYGPHVYEFTQRFKHCFQVMNDRPLEIEGGKVYLTYGAGCTAQELNTWLMNVMQNPQHSHVIAAGDDVVAYHHVTRTFYCSDFSSFDQSESRGPLDLQYAIMLRLGVPEETIAALRHLHKAPFVYKSKALERAQIEPNRMKIKHPHRPMRVSGGPDTTVGNTVVALSSWVVAFCRGVSVDTFAQLGLKIKLNPTLPEKLIFLRGRWLNLRGAWRWTPCLGKLAKLGKTMALLPEAPLAAQDEYMSQLATCHQQYSWNPVWAAFCETWYDERVKISAHIQEKYRYAVQDNAQFTYGNPDEVYTALGIAFC